MAQDAPTTFTANPFAMAPDDAVADLVEAVMVALEQDKRAIGPVVADDRNVQRVDAIFQVELGAGADLVDAATAARDIFDSALERAGGDSRTTALGIVEGDDPERLP